MLARPDANADGAHGQRLYDWVSVEIRPWRQPGCGHWLLARRSITNTDEITYYICYGPADTDLAELVRVAGARWGHRRMLPNHQK